MSKIAAQQVRHIATLARVGLAEDEIPQLTKDLDEILNYVAQLQELDTSAVPPTTHAVPLQCPLRSDEIQPSDSAAAILERAPNKQDGHFLVPKIID